MSNENEAKIQYLICSQALGQLKQADKQSWSTKNAVTNALHIFYTDVALPCHHIIIIMGLQYLSNWLNTVHFSYSTAYTLQICYMSKLLNVSVTVSINNESMGQLKIAWY